MIETTQTDNGLKITVEDNEEERTIMVISDDPDNVDVDSVLEQHGIEQS